MFSAVNLDTFGTSFMSDPSDFLGTSDFLAFDDDFSPSALEPYDQLASEADMNFFDDLFSLDGAAGAKRSARKTDPSADGPSSSNVSSEGSESASFTAPGEEDVGLPNRGGSPSFSEQSCASATATGVAAALSDDSPVAVPTLPATVDSGSAMTQQYVLVRLDNNGNVLRPANEEDVQLLTQMFASDAPQPLLEELALKSAGQLPAATHAGASANPPSGTSSGKSKGKGGASRGGSGTAGQRKPGGPCHHCGATESPQWRRGPVTKPVLCNACGTRYRRTNQLGVATPSCSKDKARAGVVRKRAASATLEREGAKAVKVQARCSTCPLQACMVVGFIVGLYSREVGQAGMRRCCLCPASTSTPRCAPCPPPLVQMFCNCCGKASQRRDCSLAVAHALFSRPVALLCSPHTWRGSCMGARCCGRLLPVDVSGAPGALKLGTNVGSFATLMGLVGF
eukprot:TRINITY_DN2397_c0_g1_i5.p1 TRINITY_DN2397_c0_g1~~TRINITY_DN2397_c0_g1_i5.p1  ORF type:complete len:454 (+),score=62.90 TRINITY_DN2397_c0_g1_i5:265-1626(+)